MKAVLLAIAALACGCTSYGSFASTRPVARGASQAAAALEIDGTGPVEVPWRVPTPTLAVVARRGLAEDLDVGGKLTMLPLGDAVTALGLEAQARWRLRRGARLELALAPSAGWRGWKSSGARWDAAHATLPFVIGWNLGAHQLYLSPRVGMQRWWSAGATPVDLPFAGMAIGFHWQLRDRLALVPELGADQSPHSLSGSERAALVHFGVAVVFDGR